MHDIQYISQHAITNKTVLLRVDYNLSLNPDYTIADDTRMRQTIPTLKKLLENGNKLIIVSHLGRPKEKEEALSLKPVCEKLHTVFPEKKIAFISDFVSEKETIASQLATNDILFLENIRYYPQEDTNDEAFSKELASLADVYVNDAFSVSHRAAASVVGVTSFLPSFGGLLLEKEVTMLQKVTEHPESPFVAIIGGSKISTKLKLIHKLTQIADHVLVGGGLANTLFLAKKQNIGKSLVEQDVLAQAEALFTDASEHNTKIILPIDVVVGTKDGNTSAVKKTDAISDDDAILDIGPETQAIFGEYISQAKTIVWNGPMGYIENPEFSRGTDFLYYAITQNTDATSVTGGGETLKALKNKDFLDHITHISTAGGAMLEFIENSTLPGLDALRQSPMESHE